MGVNEIKKGLADNQIKAWTSVQELLIQLIQKCTNVVLHLPLGHFTNRFVVHYNGKVSHKQYVATASNS